MSSMELVSKYTLHTKLGEGGYGNVHLCRDTYGNRFACKILPFEQNKRCRVQKELLVLEKLSRHTTRVPRLIDACEDNKSFYIIQEWCKGGVLKDYVIEHERYSENLVASIVRGVLRSLVQIHQQNIIHRDIKGSNIMFADKSDDAEIKLIDFGAAIIHCGGNDSVETQDMLGTPWFISPEGLSQKYHFKSDVWSIGVLTFQLLSGRMPFTDRANPFRPSLHLIFKSIFTDDPLKMMDKGVWNEISPEAKDFVRKCLIKEYVDRPSAEEALMHPWLSKTDCQDRFLGTPLVCKPFVYEDASIMQAQTMRVEDMHVLS